MKRLDAVLKHWPELIRLWPIGKRIRTKVTVMSFLWAQGGLLGYILHTYVFRRNDADDLNSFFGELLRTESSTLLYIGVGTTVFMTLLGNLIGHIIELLEHQNRELQELNAMKDKFVSTCTHDLQNPLNNIMGYAQVIQTMDGVTAEIKEFAEVIEKNGVMLTDLVRDILDLAKIGSSFTFETESLLLAPFVTEFFQQMKEFAAKKAISLELHISDDTCCITGNRKSLARILNNLVSNAIKFTPRGGVVKLNLLKDAVLGGVRLEVEDTGMGIPRDKLAVLFDTFTSASRPGTDGERSTGLGLAIVRELVAQQGGKVDVTSVEGKGSKFSVTFNQAQASDQVKLTA